MYGSKFGLPVVSYSPRTIRPPGKVFWRLNLASLKKEFSSSRGNGRNLFLQSRTIKDDCQIRRIYQLSQSSDFMVIKWASRKSDNIVIQTWIVCLLKQTKRLSGKAELMGSVNLGGNYDTLLALKMGDKYSIALYASGCLLTSIGFNRRVGDGFRILNICIASIQHPGR